MGLERRTPLKRSAKPMKRSGPIKAKRKSEAGLAKSRKIVAGRSGGRCEASIRGVCSGGAECVHHVLRRSQGGGHEPENLLHLCHRCHGWVHANPAVSMEKGWLRKRGEVG